MFSEQQKVLKMQGVVETETSETFKKRFRLGQKRNRLNNGAVLIFYAGVGSIIDTWRYNKIVPLLYVRYYAQWHSRYHPQDAGQVSFCSDNA